MLKIKRNMIQENGRKMILKTTGQIFFAHC